MLPPRRAAQGRALLICWPYARRMRLLRQLSLSSKIIVKIVGVWQDEEGPDGKCFLEGVRHRHIFMWFEWMKIPGEAWRQLTPTPRRARRASPIEAWIFRATCERRCLAPPSPCSRSISPFWGLFTYPGQARQPFKSSRIKRLYITGVDQFRFFPK